ncbi:MAG: hypothetical protein MR823_03070 [Ruminococcus sp.]|nr:hypothetical protein [Ruminococcus sp.]MDY4908736.1 hypothetical protein [Candidatus Fimenecus sp.]
MKKILSIAVAVLMIAAICVPCFAATIDKTTPEGKGTAQVKTDISAVTDNGTFVVTIPAEMPIPWNTANTDSSKDFTYSVESQLKTGKVIQVDVAQNNANMTSASGATLAYTITGDITAVKTTAPVVAAGTFVKTVTVNVAGAAWANAAIDKYSDTLTFTAQIVDA